MFIAIDFDGTIVKHAYPIIGEDIGAIEWLKKFQDAGADLILLTMRSREFLDDAIKYCDMKGVNFFAYNNNPTQINWTSSRKVYADIYIDDAAFGCPLVYKDGERPYVDWEVVGPKVLEIINSA